MKTISEIRKSVTSATPAGDRISTVKLGELLLKSSVNMGSTAKVIAKAIFLADEIRPINEPITKFVKKLCSGQEIGSALANGYKPYTVLRHLYSADEKADAKLTITEAIFDAHGIEVHIASAGILNAVDGLDNERDTKEKLVAILRSGKSPGELKKALAALKKAVKPSESVIVEMETPEGAEKALTPEESQKEMENLRAQLAASEDKVKKLANLAGIFMAASDKDALTHKDALALMAALQITGDAPEVTPEWLAQLREIAKIGTPVVTKKVAKAA